MVSLCLLAEAEAELDQLYEVDEDAAALIDTWMAEAYEDVRLLEVLFRPRNHFEYRPPFEVKKFQAAWNCGKNIFTIKIDDDGRPIAYRVLIGWNSQEDTYYVLAIVDREIAYETNDPFFGELVRRYQAAGIPTYPH